MAYVAKPEPSQDEQDALDLEALTSVLEQEYGPQAEPAPKKRREIGPMEDHEFQANVAAIIDDAREYIDDHVAPERAMATALYRGDPLGNEEDGRSQIVMTEVRDTVLSMLPPLLRIFCGSDRVVEFVPTSASKVDLSKQQTDYVDHVFMQDNPGFVILHNTFKDALVRKTGFITWYYSEEVRVTESDFTGLSQGEYAVMAQDATTEVLEATPRTELVEQLQPNPESTPEQELPPITVQVPVEVWDVSIRRRIPANSIVVEAVPPEEVLIARDTRIIPTSKCVARRQLKTISSLVAMGYEKDEIEENCGDDGAEFEWNYEASVRNEAINSFLDGDNVDPAMRQVLYTEAFVRIDRDGDGIAELRKVCTLGMGHYILHDEVVDEIPLALFCPDPEPHMAIGQSITDQTGDIQFLKTGLMRGVLDSLAQSIHPRTVIVEGQTNIDDAMNTEVGALIRTTQQGAVQELVKTFVGQQAMPIIGYVDQTRSIRTGMSPASQGLNPDILQSTTKSAVDATVNGAQERLEMIARIFADSLCQVFKGIYRLSVKHQDKPRMLKLRGEWHELNPKAWEASLDCVPNVALGSSSEKKLQTLLGIAGKQAEIIEKYGPNNPLCDLQQFRDTLAEITNLGGFKDAARYWKVITPDTLKKWQEEMAAAQANKPDPQMALVEIERERTQGELQIKMSKQMSDHLAKLNDQKLERDKMMIDAFLKAAEIEAKFGDQGQLARLQAMMDADLELHRISMDAVQKYLDAQLAHEAQRYATDKSHEAQLHKNELGAATAREAAQQPVIAE
jgi:hypothetical protein